MNHNEQTLCEWAEEVVALRAERAAIEAVRYDQAADETLRRHERILNRLRELKSSQHFAARATVGL